MIVKGPEEVGGKVCSRTARSKWDNYEGIGEPLL